MDLPRVSMREATFFDCIALDSPERWNLKLPRLFQAVLFGKNAVYQPQLKPLIRAGLPITCFEASSSIRYVSCGMQMIPTEDRYSMFKPIPPIRERITEAVKMFAGKRCYGVHIRRGDHNQARQGSPIELFVERMSRALDSGECEAFYLATDCEDTRAQLRKFFATRLFTLSRPTSRETIAGMQDAVLEMWTLAATEKIFGSLGSTFAETATWMVERPYETLSV